MLNKKNKLLTGFTLIELLVVIAIIGILAGLLLIGLTKAKEKANQARAWQSFRQIALAMQLYYDKNNSWPSTSSDLVPEFYANWDATWYCSDCVYSFGFIPNPTKPDCGYIMIFHPDWTTYIYKFVLCLTNQCSMCGQFDYLPK